MRIRALLLAAVLLAACARPTEPKPAPWPPFWRAARAIDSLNAAFSAMHAAGESATIYFWGSDSGLLFIGLRYDSISRVR